MDEKTIARFWSRVDRSGPTLREELGQCWICTSAKDKDGYARIYSNMKHNNVCAHRLAWEIIRGAIPENMLVLHKCDNPACVRPEHLFLGSQAENMNDKTTKVRQARGERHGMSVIGPDDVREIRRLEGTGLTQSEIASRFGLQQTQVWRILRGKSWRHVS